MSGWFQLGPDEIAQRAGTRTDVVAGSRAVPAHLPSIAESVARGIAGFTIISVAGFAPWALAGLRLYRWIGEAGLYAVCAVVFIALSGPLLHRLIIGPGSLSRFYKVFSLTFVAYAVAWTVSWMTLGGNKGSIVGLLTGTVLMGGMLAAAFGAPRVTWKIIVALFVGNAIGYFSGGWMLDALSSMRTPPTLDRLAWGVCYGIGFGAALGFSFHVCQRAARERLK